MGGQGGEWIYKPALKYQCESTIDGFCEEMGTVQIYRTEKHFEGWIWVCPRHLRRFLRWQEFKL